MAKRLESQDYTATVEDEDGDQHDSTVRAVIITDELVYLKDVNGNNVRREISTPTGARQVSVGDVFVETERAGVYDYLSADAWASTGYSAEVDAEEAPARSTRGKRASTDGADS